MYEAFTYAHENGIEIIEPSEELERSDLEIPYLHEGGISTIDGSRESRLLTGLALLAISP